MQRRVSRLFVLFLALAMGRAFGQAAPIELRFACWDGSDNLFAILKAARGFEAAHPGIKVEVESVVDHYQEKLLAEYAAGDCPDVAMMDPPDFEKYAIRGAILPLNPFFKETPDFRLSDYYPNIVAAHSLRGTLYVLPRDIAPCGIIYYNKELFREAGIPYPDGTWTWDFHERPELREKDFLWVMHRLTKFDRQGHVVRWGYSPGWKDLWTDQCFLSMGARFADDYETPHVMHYDDPRVAEAFQFTIDLSLKKRWMPSDTEINSEMQTSSRQMFTQQKVAMTQDGIWQVPAIRKDLVPGKPGFFDWDIALAPAYKDGQKVYPTGGSGYCIMSTTRHPHEAWLLTQWMAGVPGMKAMAEAGLAQPAIRRLALAEPWIPGPHTPADQQYPHSRIVTDQAAPYVQFAPRSPEWPEANSVAIAYLGRIYDGTASPREVLLDGNRRGQARLDYLLSKHALKPFDWRLGGLVGVVVFGGLALWIYGPELRKRRTLRERRENVAGQLFVLPWLIGLVAFTAGPMILSLLMSFADWDIIRPAKWRGLDNYLEAFTIDPRFWVSLKISALYTLLAVPSGVAISLTLALLLNTKVRGIALWRTCYYLPSLASPVAAALIWKRLFKGEGGLFNSILFGTDGHRNLFGLATLLKPLENRNGVIDWLGSEHTALPAMAFMSFWGAAAGMIILLAALQGVPQHLYEAATLDGAGAWRRFRNITTPMISPALFFCLVTGFIGSFQVFTQALVMTAGGPNDATMFYMLHLYDDGFLNLRMGFASALAWILFAIILVVTAAQFRLSKWVFYEGA